MRGGTVEERDATLRSDEPLQRRARLGERVGRMAVREGEAEEVSYT